MQEVARRVFRHARSATPRSTQDDVFSMGRNLLFLASRQAFGAATQNDSEP